jgi:hypothetical protein
MHFRKMISLKLVYDNNWSWSLSFNDCYDCVTPKTDIQNLKSAKLDDLFFSCELAVLYLAFISFQSSSPRKTHTENGLNTKMKTVLRKPFATKNYILLSCCTSLKSAHCTNTHIHTRHFNNFSLS